MRICSLLPSATEILYALGLGDSVVGITHECDYPPEVRNKRVVVTSGLPHTNDPAEIDRLVREFTARGESVYRVDAEALRDLDPDLIVTQDLCHVCAASPDDLASALAILPRTPHVLTLNPRTLDDVWNDVGKVGATTGRDSAAEALVFQLSEKVAAVKRAVDHVLQNGATRPRVLFLEWLDPPFCGGHWVPEMISIAGGEDVLGKPGQPSFTLAWGEIASAQPEVILVGPCGNNLQQASEEFSRMALPDVWNCLPAVQQGRVFITDANSYFSRPGPRLADGVAILAIVLHPEAKIPGIPTSAIVRSNRTFAASV
jgi:iron complex transport system substrate-binding protein